MHAVFADSCVYGCYGVSHENTAFPVCMVDGVRGLWVQVEVSYRGVVPCASRLRRAGVQPIEMRVRRGLD